MKKYLTMENFTILLGAVGALVVLYLRSEGWT